MTDNTLSLAILKVKVGIHQTNQNTATASSDYAWYRALGTDNHMVKGLNHIHICQITRKWNELVRKNTKLSIPVTGLYERALTNPGSTILIHQTLHNRNTSYHSWYLLILKQNRQMHFIRVAPQISEIDLHIWAWFAL